MPHGRANTIIARITTPDNDNVFSLRIYVTAVLKI
jgi:hypothetical protein